MGHYLACRRYGIEASLPYFLPGIPILGTFGAFIRIRARIPQKLRDDCEKFPTNKKPFKGDFSTGEYSMSNEFCTQTARKIRGLGVAPKAATFYSRFFYLSMLSVSGIIITGLHRKGVKIIGDETPRSLQHTLAGLIALPNRNTGTGIIIAGPAAENIVPASFRIRRN